MWIWFCILPVLGLIILFSFIVFRQYDEIRQAMKLGRRWEAAIIATAKDIQFKPDILIMDTMAYFINSLAKAYYTMFYELIEESKSLVQNDPMLSYILALVIHYTVCAFAKPPSYSINFDFSEGQIVVELEDFPNILMSYEKGIHFEKYTSATRLFVDAFQNLLTIRYSVVNNTNFITDAKKIQTLDDARHILYKYIDLIPEDEFISILNILETNKVISIDGQTVKSLAEQVSSNTVWNDPSVIDLKSYSISSEISSRFNIDMPSFESTQASSTFRFVSQAGGEPDEAYWHPISRLLLIRTAKGNSYEYHNIWQVTFLLELANLYGNKIGNTEFAYRYFENASQMFDKISKPDSEFENETFLKLFLGLKDTQQWKYLENIFSDRVNTLLSFGTTKEALLETQNQKSKNLVNELRNKLKKDVDMSLFIKEQNLLETIQDTSNRLDPHPHYSYSGEPEDKEIREELENRRKSARTELANLYGQIEKISPEYIAIKDDTIDYAEILDILG